VVALVAGAAGSAQAQGGTPSARAVGAQDSPERVARWTINLDAPPSQDSVLLSLTDRSDDVRASGAWALGLLGDERAVPALLDATADPVRRVADLAASSLAAVAGRRPPEALLPLLIDALGRPDARTRAAVARALRVAGDPAAIEPLTAALRDSDADVYIQAVEAIAALRTSPASSSLDRQLRPILLQVDDVARAQQLR
jgi:HEAT repeat protein